MSTWIGQNFKKNEFDCPCGRCDEFIVHPELVRLLDAVRKEIKNPIRITSGGRCRHHNKSIGGAKKSWHIPRSTGTAGEKSVVHAADFQFARRSLNEGVNILHLYMLAEKAAMIPTGLIAYSNWVHLDVRGAVPPNVSYRGLNRFNWPRL